MTSTGLSRQSGIRTNLSADEGDIFVLAGHAIIPLTTALFDHLDHLPNPITLIIAGGIGHSTELLYDAIARHPIYNQLDTRGKSEAAVLRDILYHSYPALARRITLYIDEKSTNCGSNAIEAKRLMDENGIWPERLWIIQDPTMHRRTIACFEKIYSSERQPRGGERKAPELLGWSFVPHLRSTTTGAVEWDMRGTHVGPIVKDKVWSMERFISLVIGEIPRMRDDEYGYGPRGKGFITHIDIPDEVEEAWTRLSKAVTI